MGFGGHTPAQIQAMQQATDYRNPQVWAQIQAATSGMSGAQKYLFAQAHRIPAGAMGFTPDQINGYSQQLMGKVMNKQTGQIVDTNTGAPIDPQSLNSSIGAGGNTTGQSLVAGQAGMHGLGGGQHQVVQGGVQGGANGLPFTGQIQGVPGYGSQGAAGQAVSNLGGGTGDPNNAAGLAGSAGNALRQQFMDSAQFNPNGANTYAIQNMNLSGQGDLGSNMGGTSSNGTGTNPTSNYDPTMGGTANSNYIYPSQTALGSGSTTGQVMPNPSTATSGQVTGQPMPMTGVGYGTNVQNAQQAINGQIQQGSPVPKATPQYFPSATNAYSGGSGLAAQQGLRSGVVRQ